MRTSVGIVARIVFVICFAFLVSDALYQLASHHHWNTFFWAAVGFPVTAAVWPWEHTEFGIPLWTVGVALFVSYPVSTIVGRLEPVW